MFTFLRRLLNARPPQSPTTSRARLGLTALETRDNPTIGFSGGVVTITAFDTSSTATVKVEGTTLKIDQKCALGCYEWAYVPLSSVQSVKYNGKDGHDSYTNSTSLPSIAYGGKGTDTLRGGSATDKLYGGADADKLYGGAGVDWLSGDAGDDYLDGGQQGDAKDHLTGGSGADTFAVDLVWMGGRQTIQPSLWGNLDAATDFQTTDGDRYVL